MAFKIQYNCEIENKDQLMAADERIDAQICGFALRDPGAGHFANIGAHDPTPTPYFVLAELFGKLTLNNDSHILDVGCGMGRVLSFSRFVNMPGKISGIELDPELATIAKKWTEKYSQINVIQGDVLDIDLDKYTAFYLFNPFDTNILLKFLAKLEAELTHLITLIHMSDNGETYYYVGRSGWTQVETGSFKKYRNARGRAFSVYNCDQHYSIWNFDPSLR